MLVAIDFSDESFRALDFALPLAKRFGASLQLRLRGQTPVQLDPHDEPLSPQCFRVGANLLLMHVVQPPDYVTRGQFNRDADSSPLVTVARLDAEDKLDELVNFLPLVGISAETEVDVGVPVERLAEETKRPDVDMVITSTHGYTGLGHGLIGSTAEQLVRLAHCPVLVVPSHCCQVTHHGIHTE